jgi:hypothetical protein
MKHTKENQKEKQWWLSLAYALGRLRESQQTTVRSLAPLEKTRGFGMTPTRRSARCFQTAPLPFSESTFHFPNNTKRLDQNYSPFRSGSEDGNLILFATTCKLPARRCSDSGKNQPACYIVPADTININSRKIGSLLLSVHFFWEMRCF